MSQSALPRRAATAVSSRRVASRRCDSRCAVLPAQIVNTGCLPRSCRRRNTCMAWLCLCMPNNLTNYVVLRPTCYVRSVLGPARYSEGTAVLGCNSSTKGECHCWMLRAFCYSLGRPTFKIGQQKSLVVLLSLNRQGQWRTEGGRVWEVQPPPPPKF
jgi:hypothetical protein